ncbi:MULTISPECIES: signal peptide peptidase SppA [Sphingobacterium]|jgi:protease-4|uniref:Signal peptide peptidase SppA n=1 Tax=Sphingobacterium litopenaei TaxID=2763500 RepID=A0ABR7YCF5_9SPHI|nr:MULTISPECIES: signal peptide peptidase SppA [Sphingobacterium]MBD1428981.1 signal peptide peptidase SppA [Sphingobacterium litopenaei]NGM74086.1 signal peptide peptidase SppA [Sphingobacterium sp. SGL-16]
MNFLKQVLATITGVLITGVILFFAFIFFIAVLVSSSSSETNVPAPANSLLYLSMDYAITEKSESNPLNDLDLPFGVGAKEVGLNDILARIKAAKTDDNIKGIFLNPTTVGSGFATLKAIRDALVDFKTSKKFIVAYSDGYSQKAYYLSSVADKVYLNPQGSLDFRGLSSSTMFMKDAFDKLGVEMQVVKVGTFKSAVEPLILNSMSEANRLQVTSYLNSIYDAFLDDLSAGRKISKESLRQYADTYAVRNADDALKYKFIDGKLYKDELIAEIKKRLSLADKDDISIVPVTKYAGSKEEIKGSDEIAVLYAYGDIVDGEGESGQIGGDKISRELRKLRQDDKVKAVVLRVNSGGGSALASDIIWREVELTKKVKPIIVSMGDYAASGGYYIAAAADSIFAEKATLTGSIGVFGVIPNFKGLMNNKLGVKFEDVKTGKFASLMSTPDKPLTEEEKAIIQGEVNNTYQTFMDRVAKGRKMTIAQVDSIGQGRVWTGDQALKIGLVDRIGDLNTAINAAASKGKLSSYYTKEYPAKQDPFASIFSTSKDKIKTWMFAEELGEYQKYLMELKKVMNQTGIQARLPYAVEIY